MNVIKNRSLFILITVAITTALLIGSYSTNSVLAARSSALIINHNNAAISGIPESYINKAKSDFRIFYGHTSHGSQIMTGLEMIESENNLYRFHRDWESESNSLYFQEDDGNDLGHNGDLYWEELTRNALNADNTLNVVMWSWCAGVSDNTIEGINTYLNAMSQLELDYPNVTFIYMTGHLWSGYAGTKANLEARNQQIRDYTLSNNKVLYDFADIETYDPNGTAHTNDTDVCNWCSNWCSTHSCPSCGECAHSHCFNCYRKGQAFWNMMARLAGWNGSTTENGTTNGTTNSTTNGTANGAILSPKILTTSGPGETTRLQAYSNQGDPEGGIITGLFPDAYTGGAGIVSIDQNKNGSKDQFLIFAMKNGGPQARVMGLKSNGSTVVLGQMFVYDSSIRDGLSATTGDFDNDGFQDDAAFCLTGDKSPTVRVYTDVTGVDNWNLQKEFTAPFGNVGCNLGTFQYDSHHEDILVTPNHGPADPNVYIYWANGDLKKQFPAYDIGVQSGLTPSGIGGRIYTTPNNGSSHVMAYDKDGNWKNFWWAYQKHVRGDFQNVAGDIDKDGKDEILISPIGSNGPQVLAFEPSGYWKPTPNFFAFGDKALRNGVGIAVIDNWYGVN